MNLQGVLRIFNTNLNLNKFIKNIKSKDLINEFLEYNLDNIFETHLLKNLKNFILAGKIKKYDNRCFYWPHFDIILLDNDYIYNSDFLINFAELIKIDKIKFYFIDEIINFPKEYLNDYDYVKGLLDNNIFSNAYKNIKDKKIQELIYKKYVDKDVFLLSLVPNKYLDEVNIIKNFELINKLSKFDDITKYNKYLVKEMNFTLTELYNKFKYEILNYLEDLTENEINKLYIPKSLCDIDMLEIMANKRHDGKLLLEYKIPLNEEDANKLIQLNHNNLFVLYQKSVTKDMVLNSINNFNPLNKPKKRLITLVNKFNLNDELAKVSIYMINDKTNKEIIKESMNRLLQYQLFELNSDLIYKVLYIIKLLNKDIVEQLIIDYPKLLIILDKRYLFNIDNLREVHEKDYYIYSEDHARIMAKLLKKENNKNIFNEILDKERFICILSSYLGPEQLYIKTHGVITKEDIYKYIISKKVKSAKK